MKSPWQRQFEGALERPRSKRAMAAFTVVVCLMTLLLFKFIAWVEGL